MEQFKQLTFYDDPSVSDYVEYNLLDNNGKVYCKLDNVTFIAKDVDIMSILEYLKMDDCISDVLKGFYRSDSGCNSKFTFTFGGVRIEVNTAYLWMYPLEVDIFNRVVPFIRCELSGTGLDFLRARGLNVDEYLRFYPFSKDRDLFHYTRVDYAYDFINYCPSFLDELINYVMNFHTTSNRLILYKKSSALVYSLKLGQEKTVYLGSKSSEKMLRCYDKRLQFIDQETGVYNKPNPYGNPDSWFRLEWQTRDSFANGSLIDDKLTFEAILRQIFDYYCFADPGRHEKDRRPIDFWAKLLPWDDLQSRIIQKASYTKLKTPEEQLIDSVEKRLLDFSIYYSYLCQLRKSIDQNIKSQKKIDWPLPMKEIERLINDRLNDIFIDDPSVYRRRNLFISKVNHVKSISIPSKDDCRGGLYRDHGRFYFML